MHLVRLSLARIGIVMGIAALINMSYWLLWASFAGIRPNRITSTELWRKTNRSSLISCLDELLLNFGIQSVNLSGPTYIRLDNPVPVSQTCRQKFAPSSPLPRNFRKSEKLTGSQQVQIHTIMHWLTTNFSKHNVELFLVGGSLLGSVRHFGMFPWDADADVMILTHQKPMVSKILIEMSASDELRFEDTEKIWGHWQLGIFCKPDADKQPTQKYGTDRFYPSKTCPTIVDFFFGEVDNKEYIRSDYPSKFPIEYVYPLTLGPYGQYLLPVPRNPHKFLSAVYGDDYERNCYFKYFKGEIMPCSELHSIYPFVTHLALPYNAISMQVDVLVFQSKMIALFIPKQQ